MQVASIGDDEGSKKRGCQRVLDPSGRIDQADFQGDARKKTDVSASQLGSDQILILIFQSRMNH